MNMRYLLLIALLAAPLGAQVASATLSGEARDPSSGLVSGVRITAAEETTGFLRTASTDDEGFYRLVELPSGLYRVTAEKPGFRSVHLSGVRVSVNQKARLDLTLQLGPERQSVTVSAAVSPVEAGDPSVGYRLEHASITALPLLGRNVISLATLGPGAIPRQLGGFVHDVLNDVQANRGAVALNPPIHGTRSSANYYLLDGAANTDRNVFAIAVNPPLESVREFRIQSTLAPAEFPQAGGGVVDVVTRTGGRAFHGGLFEFFRNEAADARNFFDDPLLPRPIFRRNQFGGSLGGPLAARSVFFAAYEGARGRSAKSSLSLVPDTALRGGDFRAAGPIFDPLNLSPAGRRTAFSGNQIPVSRIDPIARRYLDRWQPLPNRVAPGSNYLDATPNETDDDHLSARLDRELGVRRRFFGRYTLNEERARLAANFPVRPTSQRLRAQQVAIGYSAAPSAWVHELRLSFTRLRVFSLPESAFRSDDARDLGVQGLSADPFTWGLPFFLVTNFNLVTDDPILPQLQRDNLWHVSESVSWARGRHTLKAGGQWTRFQLNYQQSRLARGQFIFTGAFTQDPAVPETTGDAFADFLLGFPQVTNRQLGPTQAYLRQSGWAAYAQDDWRATRRLTLNFGLRYDYVSPYREKRNNLLNLDYSTLPRAPRLARVSRPVEPDGNDFAPRLGLALRLPRLGAAGEMVLRAGYGVYFSPEIAVETYDLIRNGVRNENNQTDGLRPLLTLRDGFPQTASTGLPSYFGLDPQARTPYVQQWTAGLQRELPGQILLEAVYLGTKGTGLGRFRTFNTALRVVTGENLPPRPGPLDQLRPFPELGRIVQRQHIAQSLYHALEIKAEKRFSSRGAFLASFAWAKSIDDADSPIPGQFESFGAQDERNLRLERGLSFFDVRARLSAGVVYPLPRGWELSGLLTLQSGTPLNPVYFAFDPANSGTPNRPDVAPGQSVRLPRNQRSAERFFNTDAFRAPRPFTFGNAGRNILPGPGNALLDLALHRRFRLREAWSLQLRGEAFNLFNHPNFGIPGPYPDFGPFFGRIFATGDPRRLQLGVRLDF